jgi:putative transposase
MDELPENVAPQRHVQVQLTTIANAFAERWVRSVKQECLSKLVLFGAGPLSRVLAEFSAHYHAERNHQGKDNHLLFPRPAPADLPSRGILRCQKRLGVGC